MVKEGALDAPKVEAVFGLHVALGAVDVVGSAHRRSIMASSDSFSIEVQGQSVHGALPTRARIRAGAAEMVKRSSSSSRARSRPAPKVLEHRPHPGGTRFNIIADRVVMDGTLRTFDSGLRADTQGPHATHDQGAGRGPGLTPACVSSTKATRHRQRQGPHPALASVPRAGSARTASSRSAP